MTKIFNSNIKLLIWILCTLSFSNLYGQSPGVFDEIINKIYNQDFCEVPAKIEILKETSPQIAKFVEVDYLWWRMISNLNASTESLFILKLDSLNEESSDNENYRRLIYFIYKIRYDNLKNKSLTRYLACLKFHFFMQNIDSSEIKKYDQFVQCLFQLMKEFDLYMEYKFFSNNWFQSKKNIIKYKASLENMENMPVSENKSFSTIKSYLLGKIYLDIEINYTEALKKFEQLSRMFPENAIFKKTVTDCKKHL
jgi:hypothetical protein